MKPKHLIGANDFLKLAGRKGDKLNTGHNKDKKKITFSSHLLIARQGKISKTK